MSSCIATGSAGWGNACERPRSPAASSSIGSATGLPPLQRPGQQRALIWQPGRPHEGKFPGAKGAMVIIAGSSQLTTTPTARPMLRRECLKDPLLRGGREPA
eukprot:2417133-Alexandrium_andersonii.AAC.1